MELTFLGTSSGTPTLQRNVSGAVIKTGGGKRWWLVDCGEGTQHQLLKTPYSLHQLGGIFITHVHGDHSFGLPGLLASAGMAGRTESIPIIAPAGVAPFVRSAIQHTDMHLPYDLDFVAVESLSSFEAEADFTVDATPLSHRVPSFAYRFVESRVARKLDIDKLTADGIPPGPAWGEIHAGKNVLLDDGTIIGPEEDLLPTRKSRCVVIAGDNDDPNLLATACQSADVLVHESTYTQAIADKVGAGPQHSSAKQVAVFAAQVALKNLVLTHFSARYHGSKEGSSIAELENEARNHYRGNLYLARDLAHFRLSSDGAYLDSFQFEGGRPVPV